MRKGWYDCLRIVVESLIRIAKGVLTSETGATKRGSVIRHKIWRIRLALSSPTYRTLPDTASTLFILLALIDTNVCWSNQRPIRFSGKIFLNSKTNGPQASLTTATSMLCRKLGSTSISKPVINMSDQVISTAQQRKSISNYWMIIRIS